MKAMRSPTTVLPVSKADLARYDHIPMKRIGKVIMMPQMKYRLQCLYPSLRGFASCPSKVVVRLASLSTSPSFNFFPLMIGSLAAYRTALFIAVLPVSICLVSPLVSLASESVSWLDFSLSDLELLE